MLPTYRTERLIVRPRTLADTAAALDMLQDPDTRRFLAHPPRTLEADIAVIEAETKREWGGGFGFWSVVPHDASRYLGWIVLIPLEGHGPETEIGWCFARTVWGQGFAGEAAARILRHGFERLKLPEIVAAMGSQNQRSARLALRLGMSPVDDGGAQGGKRLLFRLSARDFARNAAVSGQPLR